MTAKELISAGIPLTAEDAYTALKAEAALDWMAEHTTLKFDKGNADTIVALPACAKLFVCKYVDILSLKTGVSSQSIEGLSMSFDTTDKTALIWQLANSLLGGYMKSQVSFVQAKRRW